MSKGFEDDMRIILIENDVDMYLVWQIGMGKGGFATIQGFTIQVSARFPSVTMSLMMIAARIS